MKKTLKKRVTDPALVLIPIDEQPDGFPKVSKIVPPNTLYRATKSDLELRCMVTTMPDGLLVAWDTCGGCHTHVRLCRCRAGISCDRGTEYIFDQITAQKAGEEWSTNHPNYKGSLIDAARRAASANRERFGVSPVSRTSQTTQATKPGGKSLRGAVTTPKRLRKTTAPVPDKPVVVPEEARDLSALNRAATHRAKSLDAQMAQMVSDTKKRLSKQTKDKAVKSLKKRGK